MPTPKFGHDAGDQFQGRNPEGGGVLRILSGGNDRMGAKIENPRASNKTSKIPGPNINPQKTHAVFPSLKNFQKSLNDNALYFLWSYYIR